MLIFWMSLFCRNLMSKMASEKHIDDLPSEIILKIFTYLNVEDLAMSTQNVSLRWREISQDNKLWKNFVFRPHKEMTDNEIAKHLENMPALKSYAASRKTTNLVLDALCRFCRDIRSIEFHKSHVVKASLLQKIMQHLPCIESLKLSFPYPMLKLSEIIGQCQTLVSLTMSGYTEYRLQIYEGILTPIANGCPSLEHLHLENYGPVNEDIQNLLEKKKNQLRSFSCSMFITKEIAESISECTKLQHLDIQNYNDSLQFDDIQSLTKLTSLKYFTLRFCSETVANNLHTFFLSGSLSQLVHLDLSETYYISDLIVTTIFENCPELRHLNISGSQSIQNEGLRFIGNCRKLEHLDISVCMDLSDGCMKHVGEGCRNLKFLDISGCYRMTDKVIEHVIKCTQLRVFKFNFNDLTGVHFNLIWTHLHNLVEFHLENCKYLEEMYIDELHREMAHLRIVVARRCKESCLDPDEAVLLFD